MTAPRQVLRGSTYLVTRRCAQQQFLLKPSETVTAVFGYVLAVAARRYGILVHAYCVMSNHFHLVVTDPTAQLPDFEQYLASLVARALNAFYGRWEAFWGPSSYSAVKLVTPDDIVEKAAYTLANPVAAGLVRHGREWPGLWSSPERVGGRPERVERPKLFFSTTGFMPESETLELVAPPGFASAEEFRAELRARLEEHEQKAAGALEAKGRGFLGVRRVLAQKHTDRPAGREPRRKLNPRIAARDKWKRIEALLRLKEFLKAYREALELLRRGITNVVFPAGTYLLRVNLNVRCLEAG
jgi:REP element-mobilizing transposase RayT